MRRGVLKALRVLILAGLLLSQGCAGRSHRLASPPKQGENEACMQSKMRGNSLREQGDQAEALRAFLECPWENIPNIEGQAADYESARDALGELRKEAESGLSPPEINESLRRVIELDEVLDDSDGAAELHAQWREFSPSSRQRLNALLWEDLVRTGYCTEALEFEEAIKAQLNGQRSFYLEMLGTGQELAIRRAFTVDVFWYAMALSGCDRKEEAQAVVQLWSETPEARQEDSCEFFAGLSRKVRANANRDSEATLTALGCAVVK